MRHDILLLALQFTFVGVAHLLVQQCQLCLALSLLQFEQLAHLFLIFELGLLFLQVGLDEPIHLALRVGYIDALARSHHSGLFWLRLSQVERLRRVVGQRLLLPRLRVRVVALPLLRASSHLLIDLDRKVHAD